jgi:hypothetical protein
MATKTYKKKEDFLDKLMSMTDTELNDFIKKYGKPPKPCIMCSIVDKNKPKRVSEGV